MNPQTAELPLRDIHLPDAVAWWPPAPGWWLVLGLAVLIALLIVWLRRRAKRIILPREARTEFKQILQAYEQQHDGQTLLRETNALLRRIVLSYGPREKVAGLTGQAWIEQLHALSGTPVFDQQAQQWLTQAAYMASLPEDLLPLIEQVQRWIEQLPKQAHEAHPC